MDRPQLHASTTEKNDKAAGGENGPIWCNTKETKRRSIVEGIAQQLIKEECMDFPAAFNEMKGGNLIKRRCWSVGEFVLIANDVRSSNERVSSLEMPCVVHSTKGDLYPWNATSEDMLAEDWTVIQTD